MPDSLNRVLDARIAAYTPQRIPPFSVVQDRKRRRDRRTVIAVAAGSAMAVALLAGGLAVLTGGPNSPHQVAQQPTQGGRETRYTLLPATQRHQEAAVEDAVNRCLALPGVLASSANASDPPTYTVTVERPASAKFEACAADVPLYQTGLAGRAAIGNLSLTEMESLRDRISADSSLLAAAGVKLVSWGPDVALRKVIVGVTSDLVTSDKTLRERYGDDVFVFATSPVRNF